MIESQTIFPILSREKGLLIQENRKIRVRKEEVRREKEESRDQILSQEGPLISQMEFRNS